MPTNTPVRIPFPAKSRAGFTPGERELRNIARYYYRSRLRAAELEAQYLSLELGESSPVAVEARRRVAAIELAID